MAVSADFKAYVEELFAGLGFVRFRPMFGVLAVYADDLILAILADDALYFRVDDEVRPEFEAAGSTPFVYNMPDGRPAPISFWRAPDDAMEGPDEAEPWARLALSVSLRKKVSKAKARKPRKR